jgi:non-heme chloroperoxidase
MKKSFSNYFSTQDGEQLFYTINFEPSEKPIENLLIFNYGLVCSNHHWKFQLDYFDKLGYKILIHDYRGHFSSSGKDDLDKITFHQLAKDINDICEHLNVNSAIAIGHSMGVNVCLELAIQKPNLIKGLILISGTVLSVKDVMFNSNIMELVTPYATKLLKTYPEAFNTFFKYSGWNPLTKYIVFTQGFNTKKVTEEFVEIYLNKMGQLGADLFFQLFKELSTHNVIAKLNTIKAHTLIVGGDRDTVIPNYLQTILHQKIPHSELYIVKDGSHVPQADFPEYINERILIFLERISVKVKSA